MILKVWKGPQGWTGNITMDGQVILAMGGFERRLGCAVRNLLNSLEHKYGITEDSITLDIGDTT
jgi:hypothetical protein